MIRNYFKIAFRNLLKNRNQSLILVSGLSIGMAACILLLQYVSFELSFDDQHQDGENIYRLVNERIQNGSMVQKGTITYPTVGPTLKTEYPEVKNATRIAYSSDVMIIKEDEIDRLEPGLWVDQHFLEIFDFELLVGERIELLGKPNEMVLTAGLADKYFPGVKGDYTMVIGQELKLDRYEDPYKIVGVIEDVPSNSHLQFELLISYASAVRYWGEGADNSWTWSDFYHYIQLNQGADPLAFNEKLKDFSQKYFRGTEVTGSEEIFTLQALSDAHLYSGDLEYEIGHTTNGRAVWSLLIIAFFILFIAWVNYVNLSSVRAIERSKEVGVRKVIGASRNQLAGQFFSEALLVNAISLLIAFVLVQMAAPWFASNFAVEIEVLSFLDGKTIDIYLMSGLLVVILGGVFLSAAYPSWLLTKTNMTDVLKGVFSKNIGNKTLRKGLVVFQFTMSIALITATWFVARQIKFMSQKDIGIDINQVMTINSPEMSAWDSTFIERMNSFKSELVKIPGIQHAATSNRHPGERMGRVFNVTKLGAENTEQSFTSNFIHADHDYAKTYGIEPVAGRFFRAGDAHPDFARVENIVLNESATKMLGFANPEKTIGQELNFWDKNWKVVGVLPDFHQQSLHHKIEPIIFKPLYSTYNLISLKIEGDNLDQIIARVQSVYNQFFPGNTFDYAFVDDRFQRLYEAEVRFGNILSFFTLLTIIIACLGLFGLASYSTFLRTKEIGIRKILGASIPGIVLLLSKDFLKPVLIALVIAAPLAFLATQIWLEDFAYRINIEWWVFVLAGIGALLIAFLTVSFQSLKTALNNPVDSLRNE